MMRVLSDTTWSPRKIWNCFDIVNGATPASGTAHFWDGEISWVGPADLGKLSSRVVSRGERNLTESGYKNCGTTFVPAGTIILSARAPIGHVAVAANRLCFNQGCKGLVPNSDIFGEFAYWLILALKPKLEAAGQGTTFVELSRSKLKDVTFLLPPLPEQRAIAAFLDRKCAAIDEAVRIKEEQIRLLAERRQILIQEAVTRGLNPDAPMKDSGIDWIGQIPAHWEVKRLKHLSEIFRGKFTHRPRNDPRLYDGEYPFFQTGDVARAGMFLSEYRQTLNEAGLRVSTLIPKGTILITIAANIGDVTILDIDGCFPDSVVGFKPRPEIERDFLYYSMSAMKTIFMNNSIANAQANLNVDRIGGITVCLPPKAEQNVIMEYVQMANEKTDRAIGVKESQITALREYKTSLINAAVTGKIKVL
ncbi:restriction endonuclease subunit S [Gluconobacter albidus]|uniref:Restriction endonuclease subunit S n=2 Tax=Gluconobacter albidus TaxID=318683 RepID=A0ABQ5X172_9PROT|nr:restriction endonuclease subunit S [Gluconobacter albidus]GBQ90669.1 restriction endonuclease S subunit [Gluconobacter albidus NBRC 3250]GLQ69555.1 restriction endonuclease subunit S [Gluconobacter albidus]